MQQDCFICRKHIGLESAPPGGYIFQNDNWKVGHGPVHVVRIGTLVIESVRHYLDFEAMTAEEAVTVGPLLVKLYSALKVETGAERIYTSLFVEGAPHFHIWLVPRFHNDTVRGPALLEEKAQGSEEEAPRLANILRWRLAQP